MYRELVLGTSQVRARTTPQGQVTHRQPVGASSCQLSARDHAASYSCAQELLAGNSGHMPALDHTARRCQQRILACQTSDSRLTAGPGHEQASCQLSARDHTARHKTAGPCDTLCLQRQFHLENFTAWLSSFMIGVINGCFGATFNLAINQLNSWKYSAAKEYITPGGGWAVPYLVGHKTHTQAHTRTHAHTHAHTHTHSCPPGIIATHHLCSLVLFIVMHRMCTVTHGADCVSVCVCVCVCVRVCVPQIMMAFSVLYATVAGVLGSYVSPQAAGRYAATTQGMCRCDPVAAPFCA